MTVCVLAGARLAMLPDHEGWRELTELDGKLTGQRLTGDDKKLTGDAKRLTGDDKKLTGDAKVDDKG
eukprot:3561275-Rhodomonas_salina.1